MVTDLLGPRRYNRAKLDAYECGIEPTPLPAGGAGRFPIKFYLTAMLFIVFDIEIIFLYPWAQSAVALGVFGPGRDGPVHRHGVRRVRLRVAARRPGLGLTPRCDPVRPRTPDETSGAERERPWVWKKNCPTESC